jgi:hypothetical protein
MTVTPLPRTGGSSKFLVQTKRGDFVIALSSTLCQVKWNICDPDEQLEAATQLAEAIVGRHNPELPFKDKYIFADHNTEVKFEDMLKHLHRIQI